MTEGPAMPRRAPPRLSPGDLARSPRALPFLGVHDALSASLAARVSGQLFVSGFGFAASHYGLPDCGLLSWSELVAFVERLRGLLPEHHLLVDMDDGYADPVLAGHVAARLERAGVWGVVLEDQARPRGCGHRQGKALVSREVARERLEAVLEARGSMVVVARTDAEDPQEVVERLQGYAAAGADVLLADGLRDLDLLDRLARDLDRPLAFNQLQGGRSPRVGLQELHRRGVRLAIYSTPCLFAALPAMEEELQRLLTEDGVLGEGNARACGLAACAAVLEENRAGLAAPEVAPSIDHPTPAGLSRIPGAI